MNKQLDLDEAVARFVEPGSSVHFSFTHNRSHALAFELARQFQGTRSIDLIATGLLDYAIVLEAAAAVKSGLSAFAGTTYPTASPSPPLGELAERQGSEPHWTNLTVTLRLMAAALGLGAIPAPSLTGTDLESGQGKSFVDDPFGDGRLLLLEPLAPEIAFLHVPVADTDGNALVQPPLGEDLWGAWAAQRVVVSADQVVSPSQLRASTPSVGLPASRVDAVVQARFGAHPQAQFVWDPRLKARSYVEDYAFRDGLRRAARDPRDLQRWLAHWVLGGDHEAYLELLGDARLERLVGLAGAGGPEAPAAEQEGSPSEHAAVVGIRWLGEMLRGDRRLHRPLFAGIGLSQIVAFAASREAEREGVPVQLVAEVGMVGFQPPDGDPFLFSAANASSSLLHSDFIRTLGLLGGRRERGTVVVLAAGQIDERGRLNSTRAADGSFIVGSGGANDLAAGAGELLVIVPLAPWRTVEALPCITAAPRRLRAVATDRGILEPDDDGRLRLTAVVASSDAELPNAVAAARAACGWELRVGDGPRRLDPPTGAELELLRALDPERRLLR